MLVGALSRALAERLMLLDFTIGRKGFLGYVKALAGSNVVKVVPATASASGERTNGHKRLKVVCGANTSYLDDLAWIGDKTPMTIADVRVSPSNTVKPNMGATELAEALTRVLPFTAKDDNRPVLACVNIEAGEGKLTMVSADGFRLAVVTLDYDDGEGKALITRDDLRGIANALKRAKRVRIGFEASGQLDGKQNLILDTELVRYKWTSLDGTFPDWQKLIPNEFNASVSFDSIEAIKAVSSLKVLADSKSYPIDLTIGNGKVVMANPDDKGEAEINADTQGEGMRVRLDGKYLAEALRACGGMVELKLTNSYSPMLYAVNGYQLVVMPMATNQSAEDMKRDKKVEAQAEPSGEAEAEPTAEAEGTTEGEPEADKPKRKRKVKEPVGV
jgi:DNA polymerase-3 subunit beta